MAEVHQNTSKGHFDKGMALFKSNNYDKVNFQFTLSNCYMLIVMENVALSIARKLALRFQLLLLIMPTICHLKNHLTFYLLTT